MFLTGEKKCVSDRRSVFLTGGRTSVFLTGKKKCVSDRKEEVCF